MTNLNKSIFLVLITSLATGPLFGMFGAGIGTGPEAGQGPLGKVFEGVIKEIGHVANDIRREAQMKQENAQMRVAELEGDKAILESYQNRNTACPMDRLSSSIKNRAREIGGIIFLIPRYQER